MSIIRFLVAVALAIAMNDPAPTIRRTCRSAALPVLANVERSAPETAAYLHTLMEERGLER